MLRRPFGLDEGERKPTISEFYASQSRGAPANAGAPLLFKEARKPLCVCAKARERAHLLSPQEIRERINSGVAILLAAPLCNALLLVLPFLIWDRHLR